MRFVLVDDDVTSIDSVKSTIRDVLFSYNLEYEICVYKNYNKGLNEEILDQSMLKTYILSIDLNQSVSGIDIAKFIRKNDCNSFIIFLTNHGDMFETVHRSVNNIFEFIEKYQNMTKRLAKDIRKIIEYKLDNKSLVYKYKSCLYKIYYKSIIYLEVKERKLIINTNCKNYESNKTLKEMLNTLDLRFIRVSKSLIVNKDYINELNWNKGYVKFNNNVVKSVSKKYKVD